ncbi:MAG: hypothetical protein WCX22_05915 [Methanoregula sp.]
MQRTVLFERHYNVDVSQFKSTDDVDRFLEERSGKKLGVVRTSGNVIEKVGNVLPVKRFEVENIDKIIDEALGY